MPLCSTLAQLPQTDLGLRVLLSFARLCSCAAAKRQQRTSDIPQLQLDRHILHRNGFERKVHSDRAAVMVAEQVVHIPAIGYVRCSK